MAKVRTVGKGALVTVNASGDANTYVTVGLCTSVTPPPQEKATIDCTAMEDTTAVAAVGIEQLSEFSFESLHDPADTVDDSVDTLYGSGASVKWRLVTIYNSTQAWTKEFLGRVISIVPTQIDGNGVVKRTVKVIRNGAISDTVA